MITCQQVQDRMHDFLDGTLSASRAMEMTEHLHLCADCRRQLEALRNTQTLLRRARVPDGEMSRDRVLARFRREVNTQPVPAWRRQWVFHPLSLGLASAVAALLLIILALPALNPAREAPETTGNLSAAVPTSHEMDRMISLYAAQSVGVVSGGAELHHDALADANSRLMEEGAEGAM